MDLDTGQELWRFFYKKACGVAILGLEHVISGNSFKF